MANQIIPIEQSTPPSLMRERMQTGNALSNRFADNVADSFPRLSIKGKVFRVRVDGQEGVAKDPDTGLPYGYLDVVLINASAQLAKTYYERGFAEGDMNPPDCWSLDSVRPDPSVVKKVNPTCLDCPFNVFGSRITPDGKQAKKCADSRRIAVAMPHDVLSPDPRVFLLRVPQASLKNMKNYTMDTLARNGYEPGGCITRLTFDSEVAFPKLLFKFISPVTNDEFARIIELANAPHVAAMLKAPDFDNVASTQHTVKTDEVEVQQRQKPPVIDTGGGFAAGQLQQEQQARPAQKVVVEPEPEQQEEVQLIELPDGQGWLDPITGEITQMEAKEAEPQIDPAVIKTQDGRYYHRTNKVFVASQFVGAEKVSAVPSAKETVQAEPAKKPAVKRTAKPKVTEPPAEQVEQQAQAEPEPEQKAKPKPTVTAASPKLEALISGLRNNTPSGNA